MSSITHSPSLGNYLKARIIAYWLVTAFIVFELIYGALWDFNLLNQGYVYEILNHLGYPLYLATILAVSKVAAAAVISIPGFRLLKEWAYAGVTVLFMGAFISHLSVGDGLDKSIWSLLFGVLTLLSWALRPQNRKLIHN
jgi:hypothetical protein